jgi:hypothetical protein
MHCRERRRFWSDQGLSGQVVSDTAADTHHEFARVGQGEGLFEQVIRGKKDVGAERYVAR